MERTARSPGDVVVIAVFSLLLLAPALLALTGHAGFDTEFLLHTERRQPFVAPKPTTGALATAGWERDAERDPRPRTRFVQRRFDAARDERRREHAPERERDQHLVVDCAP